MNNIHWFVYILQCADGTFYAGVSQNISSRIERHNAHKGSMHIRRHGSAHLVWSEEHPNFQSARKRETQIKGWTHRKKEALIQSDLALLKKL